MENKMGHNVFSAGTTVTCSHLRRDVKKSASYIENVILFVHKRKFAEWPLVVRYKAKFPTPCIVSTLYYIALFVIIAKMLLI